jgi:nucleoside-diphosphate-sugar epimerase
MSVIITGGAGFVGLNIASRLLERGDHVVLFDLNAPPGWALRALQATGAGQLDIVTGDVCDQRDLDAAIADHGATRLVHAAAITADIHRERRAARMIADVNIGGTIEMLEAALRHKITRVVQLSTGSVFGTSGTATPLLDEADLPSPDSLYSITKFAAERIGLRYRKTRGLDLVAARLGMVFGRYEYDTGRRDTLSLPLQLVQSAERGAEAILPVGAGGDWAYATDIADGIIALLDASGGEELYHLSSGHSWSADDWANCLTGHFPGFRWHTSADPAQVTIGRSAPTPRSLFSIERMRRDNGFAPKFDLDAACKDLVTWRTNFKEDQ